MTIAVVAQIYLGNTFEDRLLQEQVNLACEAGDCLEVQLSQSDRAKSRIYATSTSGLGVGIIKDRQSLLSDGDVFQTEQHQLLWVRLEAQPLFVLHFPADLSHYALELFHLGHTLGNHHYPILIQDDRVYIQAGADRAVIEATIKSFPIPGLSLMIEERSPNQALDFAQHHHSDHPHPEHHHSHTHAAQIHSD